MTIKKNNRKDLLKNLQNKLSFARLKSNAEKKPETATATSRIIFRKR